MPKYYFSRGDLSHVNANAFGQWRLASALSLSLCCMSAVGPSQAQTNHAQPLIVRPDGLTPTLIEGSLDCSADCTITGQPLSDVGLFHSFSQFSFSEGVTVTFEDAGVSDIFARVSDEISIINGTLAVKGSGGANLFLLNSHGIVFGPRAALSLEGSFIASSAESVAFSNDVQFGSSYHPAALLTVSTPVGLQFGAHPGSIINRSQTLSVPLSPTQGPVNLLSRPSGLQVQSGETLALLGRGVSIDGGSLTANGGRIEIGSIAENSFVSVLPSSHDSAQIRLGYGAVSGFADVSLTNRAQVDVSGDQGDVSIQGQNISIFDVSSVANFTSGLDRPGSIELTAEERIELRDSFIFFPRSFGAVGDGVELSIVANQLALKDGSVILGATIGPTGDGGNITIDAAESVELTGASENTANYITASSLGAGTGGDITINTGRLLVADGSQLESLAGNSGPGGDIEITATEAVEVRGVAPASTASVATRLLNGVGLIFESTTAGPSVSKILATSGIEEVNSSQATGLGGNLTINTGRLTIRDRAQVTVGSFGNGDSGDLEITARNVLLDENAQLSAASVLGNGGNLRLEGLDTLILRRGSSLSARAGSGSGGNIFIDSDFVVARPFENSDIVASATNGQGGKIEINAQDIYGIRPRKATLNNGTNDIDASSEFGVSGTTAVNVTTPAVRFSLPVLAAQPLDESATVTQSCGASGNRFVVSARGGIPITPSGTSSINNSLVDVGLEQTDFEGRMGEIVRDLESVVSPAAVVVESALTGSALAGPVLAEPALVEAQGWHRDSNGQILLTSESTHSALFASPSGCNG